jgi:hypothetical protein
MSWVAVAVGVFLAGAVGYLFGFIFRGVSEREKIRECPKCNFRYYDAR